MITVPTKRRELQLFEVPVKKEELKKIFHAIDTARSEIEAAVADGLVDDSVLGECDEACDMLEQYLHDERD